VIHFKPTISPAGRLARLGVVIDATVAPARASGLARLCDRAGIDIVWLGGIGPSAGDAVDWGDVLAELAAVDATVGRARIGISLPDRELSALRTDLPAAPAEVCLTRRYRASDRADLLRDWYPVGENLDRPRFSVVLSDLAELADWLALVDDVVLPGWLFRDLETAADEIRAECAESGRDPATLGVGVLVPVSVGRTAAEAVARAEMDPGLARFGHPSETGIFGTLEECQDRVIAFAHAGVTDLRCILPGTPDIHDVIAQLTAITLGSIAVLQPGALRSEAPPPPAGWGGRPARPPSQRVSAGSRRR
jgi:hypothetical protein